MKQIIIDFEIYQKELVEARQEALPIGKRLAAALQRSYDQLYNSYTHTREDSHKLRNEIVQALHDWESAKK